MITLKGTPAAQIGLSQRDCGGDDLSVPAPCSACRQVTRWAHTALSWAKTTNSRMKAVVGAILKADDDILAALCGYCAVQPTLTCECLASQYRAQGLPMTVQANVGDPCLTISRRIHLQYDCPGDLPCYSNECEICPGGDPCVTISDPKPTGWCAGLSQCWLEECTTLCASCELVTLDPCADTDHLGIMTAALDVARFVTGKRATGPVLVAALALAFPGSTPIIVKSEFARIYVSLGRSMTDAERRFLPFIRSLLPLTFGTELHFVLPC